MTFNGTNDRSIHRLPTRSGLRRRWRSPTLVTAAVSTLLPLRCAGCGQLASGLCPRCNVRLEQAAEIAPLRISSAATPAWVTSLHAAYRYQGFVRTLITSAKYRHARAVIPALGGRAAKAVMTGDQPLDVRGCIVSWVPTTRQRRRRRGFDQAYLLAETFGLVLGLPVVATLDRSPWVGHQTGRARSERVRQAREAFRLLPISTARIQGRRVVLVDDVMTTGATLSGAAGVLREAGVVAVHAAVVALR